MRTTCELHHLTVRCHRKLPRQFVSVLKECMDSFVRLRKLSPILFRTLKLRSPRQLARDSSSSSAQ